MSDSSDPVTAGVADRVAVIRYLVIDCVDHERSARFWGGLLGLQPEQRMDNYLFMGSVLPGCDLVLQQVDRVTGGKSPIHFDLEGQDPSDYDRIIARARQLGGAILGEVEEAGYTLMVMADPDGNEFCVDQITSASPGGLGS